VDDARDPTGCGDVFGATLVAHLIGGADVATAVARANEYAARNVTFRGATDLQFHLRGEIVPG
jgi:sugar/nucleoside kinase (ribokinase family)